MNIELRRAKDSDEVKKIIAVLPTHRRQGLLRKERFDGLFRTPASPCCPEIF